jgi:RNA-binding protein Nova
MDRAPHSKRAAIKFLITNSVAGSIIGTGGSAIKELIEVSGAHVKVSSTEELYPGRSQRIVLISGTVDTVLCAQSLLWILFAQSTQNIAEKGPEKRIETWSPRLVYENSFQYSDLEIEGEIAVPAAAAGLIIGKNGGTIDEIRRESGIQRVNMTNKVEADFTQERILHLRGTVSTCTEAVKLIISKLAEDPETNQFVNKGVTYSAGVFTQANEFRVKGKPHNKAVGSILTKSPSEDEAVTLTINIPEAQIGNILGKNGVILREIVSLSGAKVIISNKGEYAEGTTDRIVTVKGNISTAHCAATFIQHKLHTPNPKRERKFTGATSI